MASLSPSERFNSLIEGLRSDVRYRLAGGWFPEALAERVPIILLWRRLRRLSRRFHAIMAKYRAGAVPEAVSATPRAAAARPAGSPRAKKLSQRFGWVIYAVYWFVWGRRYEMEEMLEIPETAVMVGDAPEFGSVFRPMCQMLHVKPPEWLRLARRARKPRPSRAIKHPPAPEWMLKDPQAIHKPDGTVWMRFGGSAMGGKGTWRSLEEAQKYDRPRRIWPPVE